MSGELLNPEENCKSDFLRISRDSQDLFLNLSGATRSSESASNYSSLVHRLTALFTRMVGRFKVRPDIQESKPGWFEFSARI
jgi:hypothetical protein